MNPTVRNWTESDLAACMESQWLQTLLMNATTFTRPMLKTLYALPARKTYTADYSDMEGNPEPFTFYAPSDEMAWMFLHAMMVRLPDSLHERVTTYREVESPA